MEIKQRLISITLRERDGNKVKTIYIMVRKESQKRIERMKDKENKSSKSEKKR